MSTEVTCKGTAERFIADLKLTPDMVTLERSNMPYWSTHVEETTELKLEDDIKQYISQLADTDVVQLFVTAPEWVTYWKMNLDHSDYFQPKVYMREMAYACIWQAVLDELYDRQ